MSKSIKDFLPQKLSDLKGLKVNGSIALSDRLINELFQEQLKSNSTSIQKEIAPSSQNISSNFNDLLPFTKIRNVGGEMQVNISIPNHMLNNFSEDLIKQQLANSNFPPLIREAIEQTQTEISSAEGKLKVKINLTV